MVKETDLVVARGTSGGQWDEALMKNKRRITSKHMKHAKLHLQRWRSTQSHGGM